MRPRLKTTLDPNLYTQVGLDSGSLTMLGTIVHQLKEPGNYRGAVHRGLEVKAVFYITVDNDSPTAQVTVDLSGLEQAQSGISFANTAAGEEGFCNCDSGTKSDTIGKRYTVNPRGYVLFHVSSGEGRYYVHLRKVDAVETDKGYDTRVLNNGDIFTAMILRPGTYSIANALNKMRMEAVVEYPKIGEKRYEPPVPVRVDCTASGFEYEGRLRLGVGQGMIFQARVASRIEIKLERPDDGPPRPDRGRTGFQKLEVVGK